MAPSGRPRRFRSVNTDNVVNDQPQVENEGNLMQASIDVLQGFVHRGAPNAPVEAPTAVSTNSVVEQFRHHSPSKFNGRDRPLALEDWLMELERIFTHIKGDDAQKVSCAIFQMVDDASYWWDSYCQGTMVRIENLVLDVKTPSGELLRTDRMARSVNIDLGRIEFVADLYTLEMRDFDLILGMDRLSDNHATIRCREGEVIFQQSKKKKNSHFMGQELDDYRGSSQQ